MNTLYFHIQYTTINQLDCRFTIYTSKTKFQTFPLNNKCVFNVDNSGYKTILNIISTFLLSKYITFFTFKNKGNNKITECYLIMHKIISNQDL